MNNQYIRKAIERKEGSEKKEFNWLTIGLFLLLLIYFYSIGNYLFFFQESQSLFIYSWDYLKLFAIKPGGLLTYSGQFLTQFYSNKFAGSLLLATVIAFPAFILFKISIKYTINSTSPSFIKLIPSCILLIMQTHYFHLMEHHLGIHLILFSILLYVSLPAQYRLKVMVILTPLLYYFLGGFFWIFAISSLTLGLTHEKGIRKLFPFIIISGVSAITLLFFKKLVFLESYNNLVVYPLPVIENDNYKLLFYFLAAYIAIYPLLLKIFQLTNMQFMKTMAASLAASGIIIIITAGFLYKMYNPQTVYVLQLEKLISDERWDDAVRYQESHPSKNLIGQYFYNIALSETNQLTDRLFYGRQDFGAHSLILPWNNENLNWGVHFFYSVGLINEAHRWAYEEMIVYGPRPGNIKYLVKTNLINGNYKRAEVFIDMLKNTFNYKKWAIEYENLLRDTMLINIHPEIRHKRVIIPAVNFFIEVASPQNNLPLLLQTNPKNKKAFEYMMAWFLLTKDVTSILANLQTLRDLDYERIPKHIEEAILAYHNSTKQMPELYGYTLSNQSKEKFNQYISMYNLYRKNPLQLNLRMEENFSDTFWYYFHFK